MAHPAQVAVELTDEHAREAAPLRAVRVHHVMLGACPWCSGVRWLGRWLTHSLKAHACAHLRDKTRELELISSLLSSSSSL